MGGAFSKKRNQNGEGGLARGYPYRTIGGQRVFTHRAVVERVLGRELPNTVVVHHVDGNIANNVHTNLVVCQDAAYHRLIHQREKALDACGNANFRRCCFCKEWDDPANMTYNEASYASFHRACRRAYRKEHPE